MTTRIVMPQLGESVAEGVIGKWLKGEGEQIQKDEPIVEVITDKVNAEIPSPVAGVLQRITQPEGATVAVGEEIAIIGDEGERRQQPDRVTAATGNGQSADPGDARAPKTGVTPFQASGTRAETLSPRGSSIGTVAAAERVRSSPLVRRLAEQYSINLTDVPGTGIGGRVSKRDILSFMEQMERGQTQALPEPTPAPAPPAVSIRAPQTPPQPAPVIARRALGPSEELVPLSPVRKMIADRMVLSTSTIPHATTLVEVDMTNVARYRDARKDAFGAREGAPLSYVAFVVKATVEALKEHPMVNAEWAGDGIILKRDININVAVDAPEGLTTPVIRRADDRSLAGLSRTIYDLAQRARNKKLTIEDMQGGTFTVNNTGVLGSVAGVSIINHPQAGILSAAAVVKRPVVIEQDGQDLIAIRRMMNLILSFDHRVLDGGYASAFLNAVKQKLESWSMDYPLY